jgi:DbpA RNA binding domain
MRPGDRVGAITNEAGVRGNAVGAIQIADDYSLVEVPASDADGIIARWREARSAARTSLAAASDSSSARCCTNWLDTKRKMLASPLDEPPSGGQTELRERPHA